MLNRMVLSAGAYDNRKCSNNKITLRTILRFASLLILVVVFVAI